MEQNSIPQAAPDKNNNRKTIVVVVILTSFATAFTGSSLNLSLPAIAFDYGQSATMVGWMVTIYALSVAAFAVPFGRIADITSRRRILLIGIAVFSACCGLSAVSPNFTLLLILRFAQGIGASMVFSTNSAIIISAFPPNMRGKAIGFNLAATYTGLSSGPVIGGIMNQHLGWRSIFVFTCILTLAALCLACLKVPRDSVQIKNRPLDLKGNLLFVVFIISFMFGLSQIAESLVQAVIFIAVGVVCGILFILHEYREEDPAVNVRLFKSNIGFGLSNLSAMMNYSVTAGLSYLMSLYLQVIQGFSSQTAGLIMVSQPLIMALFTTHMGKLSDRISPFKLSSGGMA
ncbi:MAG: MFS transporter [Firmicutes bacterium]|nr:MFS transporter [Bacillota bacterium]